MHNTFVTRRGHTRRLRNACRQALAAAIAVFLAVPALSQTYSNGLSADSVDPEADAVFISQMRHKMDSIRATEHRPTVALVLSGGGAKGAAHVGALKLMEEIDLPIDVICGTSMGGLVGGLYAMGYSTSFLDSLLRHQDWMTTLTDKVDSKYIPYSTKLYKEKYSVAIPFHFQKEDFETRILEQERYSANDGKLAMGAEGKDTDFNTQMGVNSLSSSLPSGYVYGFNVNNLLSSLTVGYQDSIAFKDLPIPYFAVATDMVRCKAKNWGSGSIKSAMRSTMSIPGLFDPVRTQGMVLVDGGTRNNFPVDLARAMGADYVIGVELSDLNPSYSQINNLGNILSQFITMLGTDAFKRNIDEVDVMIKPDLKGYNMLSFSEDNIKTIIGRGYKAASDHRDELRQIMEHMGGNGRHLQARPAVDINKDKVQLSAVIFDGLTDRESKMLQRKIGITAGQVVGKKDMDDAMSRIQATGAFESVTYSLLGSDAPYRLVFNCNRAPVHRLGLGFRIDSEESVSLGFNLGLNANKLMGSKLDFSAKVGSNTFAGIRYSLDLPNIPTINAEVDYNMSAAYMISATETHVTFRSHQEKVYFSNIRWTKLDIQLGARNRYFWLSDANNPTLICSTSTLRNADYAGVFANATVYTMDNRYFPKKGIDFKVGSGLDLINPKVAGYEEPKLDVWADFRAALPLGHVITLIPEFHVRNVFGSGNSLVHMNYVGGAVGGRYIEHQMPMPCVDYSFIAQDKAAVVDLALRARIAKNLYLTAIGSVLDEAETFKDIITLPSLSCYGATLELGYHTIAGPIKCNIHWNNIFPKKVGFYVSAGFDF